MSKITTFPEKPLSKIRCDNKNGSLFVSKITYRKNDIDLSKMDSYLKKFNQKLENEFKIMSGFQIRDIELT